MKRLLFRLFALCLALSWVPVTAHCRMEALGFEFAACGESCHTDQADAGDRAASCSDTCEVLENGFYKSSVNPVKVAPTTLVATLLIFLHVPEPNPDLKPAIAGAEAERPERWVPAWHFVRRAAAPAHAPDSSLA